MKTFLKVFLSIFIPFMVSILVIFYYTNAIMIKSASDELLEEMKNKWIILAESIDFNTDSPKRTQLLIREISKKTRLRITQIKKDGTVQDDSYLKFRQVKEIENHLLRPEIQDAISSKEGHINRYSVTTGEETIYYARKLKNGTILRIAYPATYIGALRAEYTRQIFSILIFLFILIAGVAIFLARRIALPIQRLDYIAENIEKGVRHIHFPKFHDATMLKIGNLIYRIYKAMLAEKEMLIQQQEKQDYIFGILEEGIILLDESNNILYSNKKAETYLNTRFVLGKNLFADIDEYEVLRFFNDILSKESSSLWEEKEFRDQLFDVNLKITSINEQWDRYKNFSKHKDNFLNGISFSSTLSSPKKEKLIVFADITEKTKYKKFKSKLVCNISHELKTPLAMIMGYAETILDDDAMPKETSTRFLQKIYKNSERINKIINNVLGLHKLESSNEEPVLIKEPTSLIDLIEEIKSGYEDKHNVIIEYLSDLECVNILYDHLYSILSNLVSNAIKYSKGRKVYIKISKISDKISIEVEDEGPMIEPDKKERIFERFYTISNSRNKENSGTGLGLPIVKHIAQLYSGGVQLMNGNHFGNTFVVTLKEPPLENRS